MDRALALLVAAASHVGSALFCAALGVVLGAAAIGPFEAVVVLPALFAASSAVLLVFPMLARCGGRRLGADVVRGRSADPEAEQLTPHQRAERHEPPIGA